MKFKKSREEINSLLSEFYYDKECIDDIDFRYLDEEKLIQMVNEVVIEDQSEIKLTQRNLKR